MYANCSLLDLSEDTKTTSELAGLAARYASRSIGVNMRQGGHLDEHENMSYSRFGSQQVSLNPPNDHRLPGLPMSREV